MCLRNFFCVFLIVNFLIPNTSQSHGDDEHAHSAPLSKKTAMSNGANDIRLMKTGKEFEIVLKITDPAKPQLIAYLTLPDSNLPISDAIITVTLDENTKININKTDQSGIYKALLNPLDDKKISVSIRKDHLDENFTFENISFQSSEKPSSLAYVYVILFLLAAMLLIPVIFFLINKYKNFRSHLSLVLFFSSIISTHVLAHGDDNHGHEKNVENNEHADSENEVPLINKNTSALIIPKEHQFYLNLTTEKVVTRSLRQTLRLIGNVLSNPSGYARLQASQNARVLNDPSFPLPLPGQKVQKDQVILSLQPTISKIETSVEKSALYKIESEIDQFSKDVARKEKLGQYVSKKDLETAKTELERAMKQKDEIISKTFKPEYLKSPLEGIVSDLHVRPGEIVTPDMTIVEIVDPSKLMIEALLFDSSLSDDIVKGYARLPLTPDKNIPLELLGVSPKVNKEDQAVHILFKVLENDPSIKLDMVIEVIAELKASKETLTISKTSINEDRTGSWVFVKINPETFEPRKVHVNRYINQFAEISEGLNVGEIVVVNGSYLLNEAR